MAPREDSRQAAASRGSSGSKLNRSARKWHKQPHNRFKGPQMRAWPAALLSLALLAAGALASEQTRQRQQQAAQPRSAPERLALEEEVDLLQRGRPGQQPQQQQHRQPHVYRVRAAQLNGKLSGPVSVSGPAQRAQQQQQQQQQPAALRPTEPPVTTSSFEREAGAASSTFGARARPSQPAPQAGRAEPAQEGSAAPATTEPCASAQGEPSGELASSVAASSGSLRLTSAAGRAAPQLAGLRVAAADATAQPAASLLARRTSQGGRRGPSLEREEEAGGPVALLGGQPEPGAFAAAGSESSRSHSAGGDSILSLIDDFDSKIITNRTKGKLLSSS